VGRTAFMASLVGTIALGLVAAPAPAGASVQCNGILKGVSVRDVTVPRAGTCVLVDSRVAGDVTAAADSYVQAIHTNIGGDINATGAQTVFIEGGSKVRGDLRANAVAQVLVFATTVRGDVRVRRSTDQVFICGSTVERGSIEISRSGRDILVGDHRSGDCGGNFVRRGNLTVARNNTDVELVVSGNLFPRGNLTVSGNTGPSEKIVHGNAGGRRIACQANGSSFTSEKNLRWKTGRCSAS
jgi:hypothetical protein